MFGRVYAGIRLKNAVPLDKIRDISHAPRKRVDEFPNYALGFFLEKQRPLIMTGYPQYQDEVDWLVGEFYRTW